MALASQVGRAHNSQRGCSQSAAADRMSWKVSQRQEVRGRRPAALDLDEKSGATHTNNNAGTVVAGNVTKGQLDPLGRGRKRAGRVAVP